MRPRKLLAALLATLAFTGVLAGPAFAGKPFTDGDLSCADLFDASGGLVNSAPPWDAGAASASIATNPCRKGSYVFTIYDAIGTTIASSSSPEAVPDGTGGTTLRWSVPIDPPRSDSYLCVTIRSLDNKSRVLDDAAPATDDPNCAIGQAVSGPPASNWQ